MNGLILISLLLGNFVITSYRSVPNQTKPCPGCNYTSIGERVCKDGIAVSQDMFLDGRVKYGDWVYVEDVGLKRINDTMNSRWKNRMDVWVKTWDEEHAFEKRHKEKPLRVWLIKFKIGEFQ